MEHGIEKLRGAISGLIRVAQVSVDAFDDGKLSLIEGAKIAVAGFQFWNTVKDIEALKQEWLDLNDAEKTQLVNFFKSEFDLQNDDLEMLIEQMFEAIIHLATAFNSVK